MYVDLGTVRPGTTLFVPFHTFDSNDPSASVTITGLATTDIEIYKDASMTQRASDAGFSLVDTDGIDLDTITGIHGVTIDLADNTTAGFYAAGSDYVVVISSITVDAATINFIPIRFRIGYEGAVLNTTIATLASQTSFTLTSGPAEDDALNGMWCWIHDVASAVQCGYGIISDYTGSTKTVTLAAGTTFTAAASDNISIMGPMPMQPTVAARTLDVTATGAAGIDWSNVENASTSVDLSATSINLCDTTTTVTNDVGVNEWNGVALGTTNPLPNAAAGAAGGLPTDSAGKTSFNDITTAQVNAEVDTALADYDPPTNTEMTSAFTEIKGATWSSSTDTLEAIRDRGDSSWTTGSGTGLTALASGTAQSGTSSTIQLAAGETFADDELNGNVVNITGGTGAGQSRVIYDYTGATDTATVTPNWTTTPDATSTYEVVHGSTNLTAVNLTAQTAGDLAALITTVDTVVDGIQTDLDNGTDGLGAIKTQVAAIETDTQDLQTQIGTAGAGLTAVPWNAAWDAEVQSEVTDGLNAYDPPTKTELDTAFTEIKGATWSSSTDTLEHIRNKQTDIETDTQDLQTQIGTAGAGLTDLGGMSTAMKAEVNTEVDTALATTTYAELGAVPAATSTLADKINWLFALSRNKFTQTATTQTLRNDADSGNIATSTHSDDTTTYTRGEWS